VVGPVTTLTDFFALRQKPTTYALAQNGAKTLSDIDRVPRRTSDTRSASQSPSSPSSRTARNSASSSSTTTMSFPTTRRQIAVPHRSRYR
jgi:hypothetical protein